MSAAPLPLEGIRIVDFTAYWAGPLPTAIMGASVSVTVGGTTVAAYPQFVSSGQINAVLPSNTPTGSGTLTVTYNGTPSNAFNITVAPSSFGTFAWDEEGTGPGIFTNF